MLLKWLTMQTTLGVRENKIKSMAKAKKKAAPVKKVAAKKVTAKAKTKEVKATAGNVTHYPYKPRKITRLPSPNKEKKWENY
jgi:hypothetical protein